MFLAPDERRMPVSTVDFYLEKIVELLKECDDISLLDLILKLLQKS
jgi:hypothetical protein